MRWSIFEDAQYKRDMRFLKKRYPREVLQMLANLEVYKLNLLQSGNPLLLVEFSFVHRESSGCHAITQQPLHAAAQTRLYVYCYVEGHEIHLICAGEKASQQKDNKYCAKYVDDLRRPSL